MLSPLEVDLRDIGYGEGFFADDLFDALKVRVHDIALVQYPTKKDPDWPMWSAAGVNQGIRYQANGDTEKNAMEGLLIQVWKL